MSARKFLFTFNPGEGLNLMCRLFGHDWAIASATEEEEHFATDLVHICRRCFSLEENEWDDYSSVVVDRGEEVLETYRFRNVGGGEDE